MRTAVPQYRFVRCWGPTASSAFLILLLSVPMRAAEPLAPTYSAVAVKSTIVVDLPPPIPNAYHALGDWMFAVNPMRGNVTGDFNGDGLEDIIIAPSWGRFQPQLPIQIWVNLGHGAFADRTAMVIEGPITVTGAATSIFVADFNGDHRPDIFIVDSGLEDRSVEAGFTGGVNHVLLSQPDGKLRDVSSTSLPDNPHRFNHVSSMADVDGNGSLDIVLADMGGGVLGQGTLLLLNDGKGVFTSTTSGLPLDIAYYPSGAWSPAASDPQPVGSNGALDLDGDGRVDLITGSYNNTDPFSGKRSLRFYQQRADRSFVERSRLEIPTALKDIGYFGGTPASPLGVSRITGADLDGDNRPDLVVMWEGGGGSFIEILRNDGNFQFTDTTLAWFGTYSTGWTSGGYDWFASDYELRDVNGDGLIDLVKRGRGYEAATLWNGGSAFLSNGSGHLKAMTYRTQSAAGTLADFVRALGCTSCVYEPLFFDATGDGRIDLVLIEQASGNSGRWSPERPYRDKEIYLYTFPNSPIPARKRASGR